MLGTHDLPAFLLASFLLWITPGPDTMYILARSIAQGMRAGVLSALLASAAAAFQVVKVAGAGYLIYLGIQALRRPGKVATPEVEAANLGRIFRQGVLTNALNPKVAIFFLAFLPQFVVPAAGLGPMPFLVLGGLFVTGGPLGCLMVAAGAARMTRAIRRNAGVVARLERLSGCVYIGLGLNLLRSRP